MAPDSDTRPEFAHKSLELMPTDAKAVDKVWREYWLPLLTNGGKTKINIPLLKGELYDSWFLVNQARKVYKHVTGGVMEDLACSADGVIAMADRQIERREDRLAMKIKELEAELLEAKRA